MTVPPIQPPPLDPETHDDSRPTVGPAVVEPEPEPQPEEGDEDA